MRTLYGLLIILGVMAPKCQGASMSLSASDDFVAYSTGAASSHTTTLRLTNTSADPAEIVVWQVGLTIEQGTGAIGSVEIESFSTPSDYLFSAQSPSGPTQAFYILPGSIGFFSDFGLPSGTVVSPSEVRNLLNLTLAFSPDARGDFRLVLNPFSEEPVGSSSWGDAATPFPTPFGNAPTESSLEDRTLLTISISSVPEPSCFAQACGVLVLTLSRHCSRRARYSP